MSARPANASDPQATRITRPMARWAEAWRTLLPKGMAHLYTTSALDELTDNRPTVQ
jgi:hypothetical protein